MKVGVLWQRFGPYHVARLQALAKRGDIVGIEVSSQDDINHWEATDHYDGFRRVTVFPGENSDRLPPATVVEKLQATLDTLDLDVLCLPSWSTNHAPGGLDWCLRRGVPAVCMTDSTAIDHPRRWWKEWVKRQIVRCFSAAHVSGQASRDYVMSLGIPRERIFLGIDAVDNDHFARGADEARLDADATRRRLGLPSRYLVTVSRLIPTKNIACLLHGLVVPRAISPASDMHLVIVGDGPEAPVLRACAAELGLSACVHFAGQRSYDEVPAYLALAEAFVLASISETWGLCVNEAMAAGLPVIVSERCGCALDLVQAGVTGFTFDPLEPHTLTPQLQRLADNHSLHARLGAGARKLISHWSLEHCADNLLAAAAFARTSYTMRPSFASQRCLAALRHRRNPLDTGAAPAELQPIALPMTVSPAR